MQGTYLSLSKDKIKACGKGLSRRTIQAVQAAKILDPIRIKGSTIADMIFYTEVDDFKRYRDMGPKAITEIAIVKALIISLIQETESKQLASIY